MRTIYAKMAELRQFVSLCIFYAEIFVNSDYGTIFA